MRFKLDDIEAFIAVMETGSFSAAGLRLDLSKSVISKRVSDLETVLGVRLLNRSTRGAHLTEVGQEFYQRARDIMQQLKDAVESATEDKGRLCGQLRIAAPMSFGTMHLGNLLYRFLQDHPELELLLSLDDRKTDIEASGVDLGIRITQMKDSTLIARKLGMSHRIVCCSPGYAEAYGLPHGIDGLAGHRCIGYSNVYSGQLWQFEPVAGSGQPRAIPVKASLIFNNGECMRDAAIAGLGLTLLPLFIVADALREGRLINAMPGDTPTPDTIYAMYPRRRYQPRKVRAVVEYLEASFARRLPWESE